MTVCVGVKVRDCLVFAADSASSIIDQSGQVLNVYQHGNKVFNLHREHPIVAMTAGMGNFGSASISNLAKDLRIIISNRLKIKNDTFKLKNVVDISNDFFVKEYSSISPKIQEPHQFSFWIGGYDSDSIHGEVWKLQITHEKISAPECVIGSDTEAQVIWGGQVNAIQRLILGFDYNIIEKELAKNGKFKPATITEFLDQLCAATEIQIVHPSMPVQDAIDLADYLVELTKKLFAFVPSANIVGGKTDIATVTRHEKFKWIRRKHYYPESLNPKETGHVG